MATPLSYMLYVQGDVIAHVHDLSEQQMPESMDFGRGWIQEGVFGADLLWRLTNGPNGTSFGCKFLPILARPKPDKMAALESRSCSLI